MIRSPSRHQAAEAVAWLPAGATAGAAGGGLTVAQVLAVAYVASVPFDVIPLGTRSLPFLVGTAFVAAALLELFRRERRFVSPPPFLILALLGLVTFVLASYFWSIDPEQAFGRMPTVLTLALTTVLLAGYLPAVWLPALWAYCGSAAVLALLVLRSPPGEHEYRRTVSGNEDDVAALLVLAGVIALYLVLSSTARRAVPATGVLIVCSAAVVATGSRGAVLAGSAGLVVTLLRFLARRRRHLTRLAVLGIAAVVVVVAIPREFVPPRLGSMGVILVDRDLTGREHIWTAILDHDVDLLGLGLGGTERYLAAAIGRSNVAHNSVLGVLLELGLIGLVLFGAVVAAAVAGGRRSAFREVLVPLGVATGLLSLALTLEWRRCLWLTLAFALTPAASGPPGPPDPPDPPGSAPGGAGPVGVDGSTAAGAK